MKIRYLLMLLILCTNTSWADFSNTRVWHHPMYIGDNAPFLIELDGDWPTDCHPGEQKPVIKTYTGDSVLIEFETIVEHVACNDEPTQFRVLVDMSDVIDTVEGEFPFLAITVRFGGAELKYQMDKYCLECNYIPQPRNVMPDPGLYFSEGLEKQGLLIARQNQRMGVYPLIYDDAGSSEWVLGPGGIVEDVFFSDLLESTGGQCLDCPRPDNPPQMNVVGKITIFMDSEGEIQVKINDGMFTTYRPLSFGYGEFEKVAVDESVGNIPDLTGRWAFVKNGPPAVLGSSAVPNSFLPLVFDVNVRNDVQPPLPDRPPSPVDNVLYSILDMAGEEVTAMRCFYDKDTGLDIKMYCYLYPGEANESFSVGLQSIERMVIFNNAPIFEGQAPGIGVYVRID